MYTKVSRGKQQKNEENIFIYLCQDKLCDGKTFHLVSDIRVRRYSVPIDSTNVKSARVEIAGLGEFLRPRQDPKADAFPRADYDSAPLSQDSIFFVNRITVTKRAAGGWLVAATRAARGQAVVNVTGARARVISDPVGLPSIRRSSYGDRDRGGIVTPIIIAGNLQN